MSPICECEWEGTRNGIFIRFANASKQCWQGILSWKALALMKILLIGKIIKVESPFYFEFEISELEKEFFEAVADIPTKQYRFWKVLNKLLGSKSKEEVMEWAIQNAIAERLSK